MAGTSEHPERSGSPDGPGAAAGQVGRTASVDPEIAASLGQRDPAFIAGRLSSVTRYVNYFSPEVRGTEHLPASGAALVVGNHSNLFYMPDVWIVGLELVRKRGLAHPAYALGYDLLFAMPGVASVLRRIGAVPASSRFAREALAEGAAVLVYPGGDREACRPWTRRDVVDLGGHRGFVRVALQSGVPVIPVVTHGSHDAVVVVSSGERLARLLGLHRLRINVFPLFLTPLGPTTVLAPPLPMPSAVTVSFLPALDWSHLGPEAADDEAVVSACYEEITAVMQAELDRLHAVEPHPVLRGWSNLLRRGRRHLDVPDVPDPTGVTGGAVED
jgi:1-acyl-sn-glycerol-3-phosphate acyltransferase